MGEIQKAGNNRQAENKLKMERFYETAELKQKPTACYIQMVEVKKVEISYDFTDLKKLIYSKDKKDVNNGWKMVEEMPEKDQKAFVKEIKAEEKTYKAIKDKKAKNKEYIKIIKDLNNIEITPENIKEKIINNIINKI
ncbi:MAG: hypothetical protein ABIH00_02760 [Armatimonadota bacterium]